jgi:microfibrillar-associated protein 1
MSAPRSNQRLPAPVKRYRAGQAPANVQESSDEEEEEEEQEQQQQQQQSSIQRRDQASQAIHFAQKEVITGVEQVAISEKDAANDRRLRRLKEAQEARVDEGGRRRRRFENEEITAAKEESDDEDERAAQRQRMKQRALEQQKAQEEANSRLQETMPIEEEEEEEEEEEVCILIAQPYHDCNENQRKVLSPTYTNLLLGIYGI